MNARGDSGAAAVELALVSVLLLILITGMWELGRLYSAQLAVEHAAREGARLAAVDHYDQAYVAGQAGSLDPGQLSVSLSTGADPSGDEWVECNVSYPVDVALLRLNWTRPGSTITVRSAARMRAEY